MKKLITTISILSLILGFSTLGAQEIPLPEHPRPDFERPQWQNLNGSWNFEFDAEDIGISEEWSTGKKTLRRKINVPFPWGSEFSGQENEADIGWYSREISIDPSWAGKRVFLNIG
ncbi:MAG: hypothetical protein R3356_02415, partial [Eudoraea sp.]|nr:hypothetical protein [Eudoraea sp.]